MLYAVASFEKMFSTMSATLADGRKWLVTNDLTLGDINLMPFVARLAYLNLLDIFIDERTHVQAWWARSKELSSYKKAIPEMLEEEDLSTMKISGTRIREQIRARRREPVGPGIGKTRYWVTRCRARGFDRDPICGSHQGQRS